jgi:hypothetical protein
MNCFGITTAAAIAQIVMGWLQGADLRHIILDLLIWIFAFFFAAVATERFFHR